MIDEVQKAVAAYRRLDTLGRRLFRDEAALETRKRKRYAKRRSAGDTADTTPVKRTRQNKAGAERGTIGDRIIAEAPATI